MTTHLTVCLSMYQVNSNLLDNLPVFPLQSLRDSGTLYIGPQVLLSVHSSLVPEGWWSFMCQVPSLSSQNSPDAATALLPISLPVATAPPHTTPRVL